MSLEFIGKLDWGNCFIAHDAGDGVVGIEEYRTDYINRNPSETEGCGDRRGEGCEELNEAYEELLSVSMRDQCL